MTTRRHALSVLAVFLALCAPALADDIELYTNGVGETVSYRLKNTSDKMRYSVNIQVTRVHPKTGDTISTRTEQHTMAPSSDLYLGPTFQEGAEMRYRIAGIRISGGQAPKGGRRPAGTRPAPFPITFGK